MKAESNRNQDGEGGKGAQILCRRQSSNGRKNEPKLEKQCLLFSASLESCDSEYTTHEV